MKDAELHFNSIKVRLELSGNAVIDTKLSFQFHKGTIRTVLPVLSLPLKLNFNSIKVRLELINIRTFGHSCEISIP